MNGLFLILSLAIVGLLLITWFFFNKKKKKLLVSISDAEISIQKTEQSIQEIKEHADELASKRKLDLANETKALRKDLVSMQSTLEAAGESARRSSTLLSNISHTLRTNLNDILGFSFLLGNDFAMKEDTTLYEYSENIRKSGDSLMHLLNNIIDISRIEANTFDLNKQNCNLNTLINELKKEFDPIAKQKGLQLFFQSKPIPLFSADSEALKHILSNILDNGIKYTAEGFVKMICEVEKEQIVITIKDTGVGIDKAYQREIFEPFRQQSPGYKKNTSHGAGLGLPLVKQMITLMEGSVVLESDKATGTTVTVRIPLTKPLRESYVSEKSSELSSTKQKVNIELNHALSRILVVDNDRINNMLIRKMLPDISQLSFATTKKELDKVIQSSGKSGEPFDVVIMNIDFVNGNKAVSRQEMQKSYPIFKKTPFVAMSDNLDISQRERVLKTGFKAYIDKPINKEKLFNTMNSSVD